MCRGGAQHCGAAERAPLITSLFELGISFLTCVVVRRLTDPLCQHLAELPVDPRLGKALLASGELGCAEEVLTIVALLSVQSVWLSPHGQRKALDAAKSKSGRFPG